jgi:hypothetical protein
MAESSTYLSLLSSLKSYPKAYTLLRRVWRLLFTLTIEASRKLGKGIHFGGPRGFYSGLAELERGSLSGRVVLYSQMLPPIPTPSLIDLAGMGQNGRQPWPIFWVQQINSRLAGSSLIPLTDEKLLMLEAVYGNEFCKSDPAYNYMFLPRATLLKGAWTSVIGRFSAGYYHWLTDDLPRLALLAEFSSDIQILARGPLRNYQKESFRMLGLLERVRETSERHLIVEDYYFSSPTSMTGCTNPYAIQWLRNQYLPLMSHVETPKKFFIQRKGKTRGIINQEEVSHHYRTKGWAVVNLEELDFCEQIALFHNAEEIVGEHGAGFTNLIWCRPGCRVTELCADNFLNGCYEGISLCLKLHHSYKLYKGGSENQILVNTRDL